MAKAKSKGQKLAQKRKAQVAALQQPDRPQMPVMRPKPAVTHPKVEAIRPTPEREAKGRFRMPVGRGKQRMPAVDEHHDAVARLHRAGLITEAQEDAARSWQALKAAVRAELGVSQGRSCLDFSPVGHDSDEGDPDLMRRWREIEAELGSWKTGALDYTCVLGNPPANLQLLRDALNAYGRC